MAQPSATKAIRRGLAQRRADRSPSGRSGGSESGAVLVEFAMISIVFFLLVFGMIDFGMAINTKAQITNASREAARYAIVGFDATAVEARAREVSANLDQTKLKVAMECHDSADVPCTGSFPSGDIRNAESGDSILVTIGYVHSTVTPMANWVGLGPDLTMSSETRMRFE